MIIALYRFFCTHLPIGKESLPATICEIITKANNVYAFTFYSGYILIHCRPLCNLLLLLLYIPFWLYSNDCNDAEINRANTFTFQSGYIQIGLRVNNYLMYRPLHSNLVIFKCISKVHIYSFLLLYIPIWFYSNGEKWKKISEANGFTFQSGSIQMTVQSDGGEETITFTFQSGSIQIGFDMSSKIDLTSLHSNLVLFKSYKSLLKPYI